MLRRAVSGFSEASVITAVIAALVIGVFGYAFVSDEMGRAFWSVGCVVMLLVLAWDSSPNVSVERRVDWRSYLAASVVVFGLTVYGAGVDAAIVVASVAISLLGMLMLLVRLRVPCSFAIGLLLVQSVLFLTWPIWAASLLIQFDAQPLVDLLVKVGPLFAINGAIDPTDAFTHRPLAYRLMNLGQDIPYEMPNSIWPSVLLHVASGFPGVLWYVWKQRRQPPSPTQAN